MKDLAVSAAFSLMFSSRLGAASDDGEVTVLVLGAASAPNWSGMMTTKPDEA